MNAKYRVIIDADTACEADDHYAIVHSLLSPELEVKAICAEHFNTPMGGSSPGSMEKSHEQNLIIADVCDVADRVKVLEGAKVAMKKPTDCIDNPASRFIVEEAMRDDPLPLFVVCQSAVTNVACAYLMNPAIADKFTLIWISGGPYPKGGFEFNACGDLHAANVIMDSPIPLWQVPSDVYAQMRISIPALFQRLHAHGKVGAYLTENMEKVNHGMIEMIVNLMAKPPKTISGPNALMYPNGYSWRLGDSPVVGLMLDPECGEYEEIPAPSLKRFLNIALLSGQYKMRPGNSRKIRVYKNINSQFILEDLFKKVAELAPGEEDAVPYALPKGKKVRAVLRADGDADGLYTCLYAALTDRFDLKAIFSDDNASFTALKEKLGISVPVIPAQEQAKFLTSLVEEPGQPVFYISLGDLSPAVEAAKSIKNAAKCLNIAWLEMPKAGSQAKALGEQKIPMWVLSEDADLPNWTEECEFVKEARSIVSADQNAKLSGLALIAILVDEQLDKMNYVKPAALSEKAKTAASKSNVRYYNSIDAYFAEQDIRAKFHRFLAIGAKQN